jgi:hypothetical protein
MISENRLLIAASQHLIISSIVLTKILQKVDSYKKQSNKIKMEKKTKFLIKRKFSDKNFYTGEFLSKIVLELNLKVHDAYAIAIIML